MALGTAHEGYEYQDYLTVGYIMQEMIKGSDSVFIIDKKDSKNDKFDDLKIIKDSTTECIQIKYSNEEVAHKLSYYDLSNGNGHDTALDTLFFAWKELKRKYANLSFELCVAWDQPDKLDNDIRDVIEEDSYDGIFSQKRYRILADKIWTEDGTIKKGWKRFKKASAKMDRAEFVQFCEEFSLKIEYPKASLDLDAPGELEYILFGLAKKLGVGVYPNNIALKDFIYRFVTYIKNARTRGGKIAIGDVIQKVGLITDYGKLEQRFQIDEATFVRDINQINSVLTCLEENGKVIFTGEPGAGKSWFVEDFVREIKARNKNVVRFNCYISMDDPDSLKRIQRDVFYGNLINEILNQFPELTQLKKSTYGADKEEVENLLSHIEQECFLIVDGLDHIDRVYELKKGEIEKNKTDIIEALYCLDMPKNIKVLLSSQPLSIYDKFYESGFFPLTIGGWNKERIRFYLQKNNLQYGKSTEDEIVDAIFEKSNGNALYINYLVKEIEQIGVFDINRFGNLPRYSVGLKDYYKYLIVQVALESVAYTLAGLEFYVTNDELKEITGQGELVDSALVTLAPILRTNVISGGIIIYHESFRRYIIDYLKEKGVDVKKVIYRDTIEWLSEDGMYKNPKAFYYLLELLVNCEAYTNVLTYLNEKFVHESMYYGYSRRSILKNYRYFLNAACSNKSFADLSMLSEIGNMLDLTVYEVEGISKEYMEALAEIHGANRLNACLEFDGQPTYSTKDGLEACYICSQKGIPSWWDLYWKDKNTISIDEMKFFVRHLIDENGITIIDDLLKRTNEEMDIKFRDIIFEEVITYITEEELREKIAIYKLKCWKETCAKRDDWLLGQKYVAEKKCIEEISNILSIGYPTGDKKNELIKFFKQIGIAIRKNRYRAYLKTIESFSNINWFYNWCIYILKTIELHEKVKKGSAEYLDEDIIKLYQILLEDTEVFKGEPRTCDLFHMVDFIKISLIKPLSHIKTGVAWEQIIDILLLISEETETMHDGYSNGPLPAHELIDIFKQIINDDNKVYVLNAVKKIIDSAKHNLLYGTIASFHFQAAVMEMRYGEEERAKNYYQEGIKYSLSYSSHKEISLEQVIESYPLFYQINSEEAKLYREEITDLTVAVLKHTDGRETKHFLNRWFRELISTDINYAVNFFLEAQFVLRKNWIFENMAEDLIEWMTYNGYPYEASVLIESLPNRITNSILDCASEIIDGCLDCDDERNAKRLYINILSRFNFESMHRSDQISKKNLIRLCYIGKRLDFDIPELKSKLVEEKCIFKEKWRYVERQKDVAIFSLMTYEELLEWCSNNTIAVRDINGFLYRIEELQLEDEQIKELFHKMIYVESWGEKEDAHIKNIQIILKNSNVDNKIKAYGCALLFTESKNAWYRCMDNIELFVDAINYDYEMAIDTLFDELYRRMGNLGYTITTNLMRALIAINYDEVCMSEIWKNTYKILQMRLPHESKHEINCKTEYSVEEALSCAILGRTIHGEKERALSAISYLIELFQSGQEQKSIVPIKWALQNFNQFNYLIQLAILQLILHGINSCGDDYGLNYKVELGAICGTKDMLIDLLITAILSAEEYEVNYDYAEDSNQEYINRHQQNTWKFLNRQLQMLDGIGFDVTDIIRKCIVAENREKVGSFYNRAKQIMVENIEGKSILLECIVADVYQKMGKNVLSYSLLTEMLIDYSDMCHYRESRHIIPRQIPYESGTLESIKCNFEKEFISVAFHEKRKNISYNKREYTEIFRGMVLEEISESPFNESLITGHGIINIVEDENAFVVMNKVQDEFENQVYLWPVEEIISEFIKDIIYDSREMEFVGLDYENNIVMRFYTWRGVYLDDDDYSNHEIPCVEGEELLMRSDLLKKIQNLYGNLYIQTSINRNVE